MWKCDTDSRLWKSFEKFYQEIYREALQTYINHSRSHSLGTYHVARMEERLKPLPPNSPHPEKEPGIQTGITDWWCEGCAKRTMAFTRAGNCLGSWRQRTPGIFTKVNLTVGLWMRNVIFSARRNDDIDLTHWQQHHQIHEGERLPVH